jgi:Ethylbenzene dehydrogenase
MRLFAKKYIWVMSTIILFIGYMISCTHDVAERGIDPITESTTLLLSLKTTVAPSIDGKIDAFWNNAPKLKVQTTVPNPGNYLWASYIGKTSDMTLRSVYDDQYIYFLAEWTAPVQSVLDRPWYFNPTTKLWAREAALPVFDDNGFKVREAFNEDKMAFLWNINNSTIGFDNQSCYTSCHMNSPTTVGGAATGGNHWTNQINERIDMWHYHLMKDAPFSQLSDEYQDWAGGLNNGNGRKRDNQFKATDGTTTNTQNLTITGTTTSVAVPRWIVPDAMNQQYILASDTLAGGTARLVTAVSTEGVLTYTGGTINPNIGTNYQRDGAAVGIRCISSVMVSPFTGNRADITAKATYTGTGYIAEIKRKLKTEDTVNQDVDFSDLKDKVFGVAVFNRADIAHAIKPNLVLSFKK